MPQTVVMSHPEGSVAARRLAHAVTPSAARRTFEALTSRGQSGGERGGDGGRRGRRSARGSPRLRSDAARMTPFSDDAGEVAAESSAAINRAVDALAYTSCNRTMLGWLSERRR